MLVQKNEESAKKKINNKLFKIKICLRRCKIIKISICWRLGNLGIQINNPHKHNRIHKSYSMMKAKFNK